MKKNTILFAFLTFCYSMISAAPTGGEQAQIVATNFYKQAVKQIVAIPQLVYTATTNVRGNEAQDCFYVYNIDNGFVIVSADDRVKPILGYSTEGAFDPQDIPFGLQDLFRSYTEEIGAIMQHVPSADAQLQAEWQSLTDGSYQPVRGTRAVDALLTNNNWQQNNGYNYYCPTDANGPAGHCYVGCCALSMGQVMHYWQHPSKGEGSHSYECNHSTALSGEYGDYGTLSANFGETTYNFANMPNYLDTSTPSNQIVAIAKLLYHAGISIDMWYGNQGSMAFHDDIAEALETYFKYDECQTLWKNSYSGSWEDLLKADLDLGRPIIYCAYANVGGHEFVCDGYNANNFFHFNMGWGGSFNGFYAIDNLNAQYNFDSSHGAIVNIRPRTETPEGINGNDINVSFYPNPVATELTIESDIMLSEIQLYDIMGKRLYTLDADGDATHTVEMGNYAPGTYFVRIISKDGNCTTKKVIKK